MQLDTWARKWGVTREALDDLRRSFGMVESLPEVIEGSEAAAQNLVRLEASELGLRLWRNNVGAGLMDNGSFLRWGLCNDSKAMNAMIKSADLVGIRPVLITPDHVGRTIGQFVARECKRPGWNYTGNEREQAQLRFLELVAGMGGDAAFATGRGSL